MSGSREKLIARVRQQDKAAAYAYIRVLEDENAAQATLLREARTLIAANRNLMIDYDDDATDVTSFLAKLDAALQEATEEEPDDIEWYPPRGSVQP